MENTFTINIDGYWRDRDKSGIPNHSGVYFVYEARYNHIKDTVLLIKLIYIGESEDVKERIASHHLYDQWLQGLREGHELFYSTGQTPDPYRKRIEAAYIFKHKPIHNTEFINYFPFEETTIISEGRIALLSNKFTIQKYKP